MSRSHLFVLAGLCVVHFGLASARALAAEPAVDFDHDIQPILANHCYKCHGPDAKERKAGLRFDEQASTRQPAESGKMAIVPGKPDQSEVVKRIFSTDADVQMPPADGGKPLNSAQRELLKRWIAGGGDFARHWSYITPVKPAVPAAGAPASNPIDHFLAAKFQAEKLAPAGAADRRTLLRRVSLDLLGLPPAAAEVEAFVTDRSPDAYEKQVDRLLASPHYGERMALSWLDLVRYADTCGYHSDNHRDVWMYRDYVIRAFNDNKPFDQFTIEQLAGDLLPNATDEQRIASGYNRLLMTTEEGGAQPREYTAKYAADRVRNVSVVWLGLTLGCCECHDHKYDPYTSRDFYRMAAFFADVDEKAVGRQDQTSFPTPEQSRQLAALEAAVQGAQAQFDQAESDVDLALPEWESLVTDPDYRGEKLSAPIAAILSIPEAKREAKQRQTLLEHYRKQAAELTAPRANLEKLKAARAELQAKIPTTLVSKAVAPRPVRILARGNWLDESGQLVTPATPAYITAEEIQGRRATRLDLAKWIVDPRNPLTARVFVNRIWKLYFGAGLVRTSEDLGRQGERPIDQPLLDWLACDFMEHGWDVRRLVREIVLSEAYRRSSVPTAEQKQVDPANVYLARQNRFRIDAEFVRDNALAISGLLVDKIGGPSVKPYQPAGYWAYLNFPTRDWIADKGADQYRRGLYTYWQRTFAHPMMLTFDAPSREECTADRPRANIPQQALVLLNDPTFVEAARVFAENILRHGGGKPAERIQWAYSQALARHAEPEETTVLLALLEKYQQPWAANHQAVDAVLSVGDAPIPADLDRQELAAWTGVARAILNLHETITRN